VFEASPYQNTWDGKCTIGLRVGGNELPIVLTSIYLIWVMAQIFIKEQFISTDKIINSKTITINKTIQSGKLVSKQ